MAAVEAATVRAVAFGIVGSALVTTWVVLAPQVSVPPGHQGWYVVAAMLPSLIVSMLLLARLPGAAVTRLVATMTMCQLAMLALDALRLWRAENGGPPFSHEAPGAGSGLLAWASSLPWWMGTLPLLPVLLVVFPDGVPRRGVWLYVFRGQLVALALGVPVVVDQADGVTVGWLGLVGVISGLFMLLTLLARTVVLVWLWRHSQSERRRQLRPFVLAAAALAGFYVVTAVLFVTTGSPGTGAGVLAGLSYAFVIGVLPAAIGLSVLRHRLYGIEIVVSRLAVVAVVSALLFGVYAAASAGLDAVAGRDQGLRWEPLLATGLAVAALGPIYRLARVTVHRLMFGDRDRPDRAIRQLAAQLGAAVDPLDVPQVIVGTVARALRLPFVGLDIQTPSGRLQAAAHGVPSPSVQDGAHVDFPITYGGEVLGWLIVSAHAGGRTTTATDRAVLTDLAAQAGAALFAGRLVTELAESRERLRQDRLDERSRLRRALHDGVSPTLSGIAIAAAAAGGRDSSDPVVRRLLRRIEEEAGAGAVTLHALLDGLRPPGLDELGLLGAIQQRAIDLAEATAVRFEVRAPESLPALDPHVEQAAYLVTVEAMANVARHAAARRCYVSLDDAERCLRIRVRDDGAGIPHDGPREGFGLRSARERAAACGGHLVLTSPDAGGTQVELRLPTWADP